MSLTDVSNEKKAISGNFSLRRAARESLWPMFGILALVVASYTYLHFGWVQSYIKNIDAYPQAVDFGHKFLVALIIVIGAGTFITKVSSYAKGKQVGFWVGLGFAYVGVSAWWLRGVHDNTIDTTSTLAIAANAFAVGGLVVVALFVVLTVSRRIKEGG